MTLLLDTSTIGVRSLRAELTCAFRSAGMATGTTITPLVPDHRFHARLHRWDMGSGCSLVHVESGPVALSHSISDQSPDSRQVALVALSPGDWMHCRPGGPAGPDARGAGLVILDSDGRFEFRRNDHGTATALVVTTSTLHLSPATVRKAAERSGPSGPLYALFVTYLAELRTIAYASPGLLPELGPTTIALADTVLRDIADCGAADVRGDLVRRIRAHIDASIADPDLNAASIAAAHHVSIRTVYNAWTVTGRRLQDYIIDRRLDHAREMLRDQPHLSIATVAHRHGFVDATHFARRFRTRFGVSPREWRRRFEHRTAPVASD
ncbi:helix-turn-helix transcriptional regulator [Gordonia sp. CPCC 206044]|uniref:helix-turn-helix transcriptional regulator n=1 Tax=Gordonia sp. CPCC 206044 TaxID=3140793 RepID=UPI003AF353C3